ncbi:MAG: hypothetical protein N4A71_17580 [Carboxylicivirga sp.]|nr:hypothetical protein [Carboxylicivirga sp.]
MAWLILLVSCTNLKLPKAEHSDQVKQGGRYANVHLTITNKKLTFNNQSVTNIDKLPRLINEARDTSKESARLNAIISADKNCFYHRIDKIIGKLRESALFRCYYKTNSLEDSTYMEIIYPPAFGLTDSLDMLLLKEISQPSTTRKVFAVNKHSSNSLQLNNKIIKQQDFINKLTLNIMDTLEFVYLVQPNFHTTIGDVIELVDLFKQCNSKGIQDFAMKKYGMDYKDLDSEQKWLLRHFRPRKSFIIIPKD